MPTIRANTAVDPSQIADMFNPIAQALKPPTGQEILAGAKSRQIQQQVQYTKDLYDYAASQGMDQRLLDNRLSVIGTQNGGSSLTAVGMNNANALRTNAADNARALQQTGMQQAGETERALLNPVGESQTRFVPPSIASRYQLPAQQVGVVKANEGQVAALPGGGTVEGRQKPLNMSEMEAAVFGRQDPAFQRSVVGKGVGYTNVLGPDGKVVVMPNDQAAGQTPAPAEFKPQIFNYDLPNGAGSGTASTGPDGKLRDTQTGAELPQGSKTYTANLSGSKDETGLGASAKSQLQSRGIDIANAELTLNNIDKLLKEHPEAFGLTGKALGLGQDILATGKEAAALLGPSLAPQAQKMIQDVETGALPPELRSRFNTAIPQTKLLEQTLLAQFAKLMDPNGRLSNQQMDIYGKALGIDGMLGNADKTRAVVSLMRQMLEQQRAMYSTAEPGAGIVRPQPNAGADANAVAPPKNGATIGNGAPARRRYNPATGALE